MTDLGVLRNSLVGPLAATRPKLQPLLSAVDGIVTACQPMEAALFAAAQTNWTPSGPCQVLLPLFPVATAAHLAYAHAYATAVSLLRSLDESVHPVLPPAVSHGWTLWDFLAAPIARMTQTADMAKATTGPGSGELALAATACAEDVAQVVWEDTVPLLRLSHGSVSLGTERLVRSDGFTVARAAPGPVLGGQSADVILMQDRLIVAWEDGKSTTVRCHASNSATHAPSAKGFRGAG